MAAQAMDAFKTDKSSYSLSDFLLWDENKMLVLSPKFQRRPVWRTPARSYFIDTLLRGMTVPPLYFRKSQKIENGKAVTIREVVDGQQRVRSALDYVRGLFKLSKTLNADWAGRPFTELSEERQQAIMSFVFTAEIFQAISDKQVLEVFCRLNMNGVPLNKQELRNGKFFGLFKQSAYDLALTYLQFWRTHKMFSEQSIARMLEVELTSELLIAGTSGMQDKKNSIDDYYEAREQSYPSQDRDERRFKDTMAAISETFPNDDLAGTEFRRPPIFYSLYCVFYHHMFGLPGAQRATPKKRLNVDQRNSLKDAAQRLSEMVAQAKNPSFRVPEKYQKFVAACQRQTDNILPRRIRFTALYDEAF